MASDTPQLRWLESKILRAETLEEWDAAMAQYMAAVAQRGSEDSDKKLDSELS